MAPLFSDKAAQEGGKSHINLKPGVYSYVALNLGFSTFLREYDFTSDLPKIKCPTLIMTGKND